MTSERFTRDRDGQGLRQQIADRTSRISWTGAGLFVSLIIGAAIGAAAHHGTAASYDQEVWITVEGVVTEFYWRNPHSALFIERTDDDGNVSEYGVELASPTLMVSQGYNRNVFKPGDRVEIRVHPSKAGAPVGECLFSCQILVNGEEPEQGRQ